MSFFQRLPANSVGKDYICGDLHGHYNDLMLVLQQIGFDFSKDRLFSVGDLIDRGPENELCVQLLKEPWFFAVRGNHEQMMINAMIHRDRDNIHMWRHCGGDWSFHYTDERLLEMAKELDKLPHVIVVGEGANRFNVLHAEPEVPYDQRYVTDHTIDNVEEKSPFLERGILWGRTIVRGQRTNLSTQGLSPTFVGHSIVKTNVRFGTIYYLDRGAFLKNLSSSRLLIACATDSTLHEYDPVGLEYKVSNLDDMMDLSTWSVGGQV